MHEKQGFQFETKTLAKAGLVYLSQGGSKSVVGAVEACSELGADTLRQLGSTQALYGILGHISLPLWCDGRRVHKRYPLDDLHRGGEKAGESICDLLFC